MIFHGSIYHHEIPEFLEPYLETEAMQRLKLIDMNCGMNYTSYPRFKKIEAYSRFHHSLGCALIVWHFTHDRVQSLAALFHDIATPAFSHVVDFVYGDYENQETTEDRTAMMIRNDPGIMSQLKLEGIDAELVSDYHLYPIADNASPRLCADRLEYISSAGLRVLMKLRKKAGKALPVLNVSPEVFEVFEMTGFTELLDVKKRLREIAVEG